ncbi:pre-mRNA splicing factor SR-like 1 isoform X2 [Salvia hispanica]|uniref:pre-mRNA splicing factor SR-like 1 isoform X2 n=1 Tax=Salvia hispanica TaxID=49212 RepID=UPI0020097BC8|nr:pre-mRNA splicing factor SR-like 1 isoform X2 [Salvia hispanica]
MSEIKSSGRPFDQLLEKVLCMNILSSDYFRDLLKLKTYHEVIDEIYVTVTHVEPWMTGNCRGPSTAFCLLYKFFLMKLTVKQMHGLLTHPDSPYIRAIGFLYLRYVADPKTLWGWCEPYVKDDEEFSPGCNGRMTTMGAYVRDLLLGQYYFDTLLPRIPVLVLRTIVANLENMKLPSKHCGVTGETTRGSEETARRPPSVKAALSVSFGQRAPHRTLTRDSSPVRRTVNHSYDRGNESRRSPHHSGSQNGDLSDRDYPGRERDRGKDGNSDQERTRDRYRDRDDERRRELDKGKDRKYDDYDRRSRDSYRRSYDRRGREDYRREGSYDRKGREDHRREGSSRHSRSRSRSRSRSQSTHDYGKHSVSSHNPFSHETKEKRLASSNLAELKDLYGVSSNQKDGVAETSEGRPYRPGGTEEVIRLGGSSWR